MVEGEATYLLLLLSVFSLSFKGRSAILLLFCCFIFDWQIKWCSAAISHQKLGEENDRKNIL